MHDFWAGLLQNAKEYWTVLASAKSEVLAAWFQAVGSVGAIVAAIWISRHQATVTRTLASGEFDRRSEAVSAFAAVQQLNIRNEAKRIRKVIADNEANLGVLKEKGADAALLSLLFATTSVDNYILTNANALPREARLAFPQLIALKEMYNAKMRELYEAMEASKETDLPTVNNVSGQLLASIERLLTEIRNSAAGVNDAAVLEMRAEKKG